MYDRDRAIEAIDERVRRGFISPAQGDLAKDAWRDPEPATLGGTDPYGNTVGRFGDPVGKTSAQLKADLVRYGGRGWARQPPP